MYPTKQYTVSMHVPALGREVTREWVCRYHADSFHGAYGPWETQVGGVRWVLWCEGRKKGFGGVPYRRWMFGPDDGSAKDTVIVGHDESLVMREATRRLDVYPVLDAVKDKGEQL